MKKGCIIVPVRNRETHLSCFLLYMKEHFHQYPIIVVEQFDDHKWNKGLLYNAAFKEYGHKYDYVILHDVDFIPEKTVDYSYCEQPTLLSTECSQFNYGYCYDSFFGGVVGIAGEHYTKVNGFTNLLRGWGGDDDIFYSRCKAAGLTPQKRMKNRFECFTHPRLDVLGKDLNNPDYLHNLSIVNSPANLSEGLTTSLYSIQSIEKTPYCTHLKIRTYP